MKPFSKCITAYGNYNNAETQSIQQRYADVFTDMTKHYLNERAASNLPGADVDELSDSMKGLVLELEYDHQLLHSFTREAVGAFLKEVRWEEIAEYHLEELDVDLSDAPSRQLPVQA